MPYNRSFTPKNSGTMDAMLAVKGDVWVCTNGQAMSLVQNDTLSRIRLGYIYATTLAQTFSPMILFAAMTPFRVLWHPPAF
jgi:hypothetical protein